MIGVGCLCVRVCVYMCDDCWDMYLEGVHLFHCLSLKHIVLEPIK